VAFKRLQSGDVRVLLNTQGRYWAQVAYQFAHEFCDVLANVPPNDPGWKPSEWIEESLCETASQFALRSMARSWAIALPYGAWVT
jgi:hypothetical protein